MGLVCSDGKLFDSICDVTGHDKQTSTDSVNKRNQRTSGGRCFVGYVYIVFLLLFIKYVYIDLV